MNIPPTHWGLQPRGEREFSTWSVALDPVGGEVPSSILLSLLSTYFRGPKKADLTFPPKAIDVHFQFLNNLEDSSPQNIPATSDQSKHSKH